MLAESVVRVGNLIRSTRPTVATSNIKHCITGERERERERKKETEKERERKKNI